ncbi:MAG: hypothetical protein JNL96_01755, partial [Planctomycetaceae bacterium]|nr:hypothetical protein [Planctomycetaceae bacterium]
IARGFMPGVAGLRGVAIGTPEKTHFAFDSERCVLSAAWTGDFAEIGGWFDNGRGTPEDNALKPLGKIVWRAPENAGSFQADGGDSTFVPATKFSAVWATKPDSGFRYAIEAVPGKFVQVEERVSPTGDGFQRRFVLLAEHELPALRLPLADGQWKGKLNLSATELTELETRADGGVVLVVRLRPGRRHTVDLDYIMPSSDDRPASAKETK